MFVAYPLFKKEWWVYRRTCHANIRNELMCHMLKEKCLAPSVKSMVGDMKIWTMCGIH